jgi:hypothetical protein
MDYNWVERDINGHKEYSLNIPWQVSCVVHENGTWTALANGGSLNRGSTFDGHALFTGKASTAEMGKRQALKKIEDHLLQLSIETLQTLKAIRKL